MKINPYQIILIMVTGFLTLGYVFPSVEKHFYMAALTVGIFALISNFTRDWIIWGWEKFSFALGWINSKILLVVIFFFFLTPIAFLYRLLTGDVLMVRKPPNKSTFFDRNHTFSPIDLENPW